MLTPDTEALTNFVPGIGPVTGFARLGRGLLSWLMVPVCLVGKWWDSAAARLDDPAREADGLTIILTGIQGRSLLEQQIALGIADAGLQGRIEIVDWTTGNPLRFLQHLRGRDLAAQAALQLAERIGVYRSERPEAPVHVIGYSGGGYVTLLILEALPMNVNVTSATLLAPSASPYLDVQPLAEKTERGLTHFCSALDLVVLGLLTTIVGTTDGWHVPAAGLVGFRPDGLFSPHAGLFAASSVTASSDAASSASASSVSGRYRQHGFTPRWLTRFHGGGHFGYANRVWACEVLGASLVRGDSLVPDPAAIDERGPETPAL